MPVVGDVNAINPVWSGDSTNIQPLPNYTGGPLNLKYLQDTQNPQIDPMAILKALSQANFKPIATPVYPPAQAASEREYQVYLENLARQMFPQAQMQSSPSPFQILQIIMQQMQRQGSAGR